MTPQVTVRRKVFLPVSLFFSPIKQKGQECLLPDLKRRKKGLSRDENFLLNRCFITKGGRKRRKMEGKRKKRGKRGR